MRKRICSKHKVRDCATCLRAVASSAGGDVKPSQHGNVRAARRAVRKLERLGQDVT